MLPTKFKAIGLAVAAITFAGILLTFFVQIDGLQIRPILFALVLVLCAAILAAIFSKEKIEDERTDRYRHQAFKKALFFGVLFALLSFTLGIFFSDDMIVMPAISVIVAQMVVYLVQFHLLLMADNAK